MRLEKISQDLIADGFVSHGKEFSFYSKHNGQIWRVVGSKVTQSKLCFNSISLASLREEWVVEGQTNQKAAAQMRLDDLHVDLLLY